MKLFKRYVILSARFLLPRTSTYDLQLHYTKNLKLPQKKLKWKWIRFLGIDVNLSSKKHHWKLISRIN